mgnify:CR=1 FL=1
MYTIFAITSYAFVVLGLALRFFGRAIQRVAIPGPSGLAGANVSYRAMLQHYFADYPYEMGTFRQSGTVVTNEEGEGDYLYYQLIFANLPVFVNDNEFIFETDSGETIQIDTSQCLAVLKPKARGYLPLGYLEALRMAGDFVGSLRNMGTEGFDPKELVQNFYEERKDRIEHPSRARKDFFGQGVYLVEHIIEPGDRGMVRMGELNGVIAVGDDDDLDKSILSKFYFGLLLEQVGSMVLWSGLVGVIFG